jgi:hypothetical protein
MQAVMVVIVVDDSPSNGTLQDLALTLVEHACRAKGIVRRKTAVVDADAAPSSERVA